MRAGGRWIGAGVIVIGAVVAVIVLRGGSPVPDLLGDLPGERPTPVERPGRTGSSGRADPLVVEATAERAAGHALKAHALLTAAYARAPQPATLLQLAEVEAQLGRCREAQRTVGRVLEAAPPGLVERAQQLLAQLGRCD